MSGVFRGWAWGLVGFLAIGGCRDDGGTNGGAAATDGGSSSATDGGTDSGATTTDGEPIAPLGVGEVGVRRLTQYEYDNTIEDILGDDTRPAGSLLPEDLKLPFDNDYTTQQPSRVLVEGAETLAGDIAMRLVADPPRRDSVVGCTPSQAADASCMRSFVRDFGRLALRRPLSGDEIDEFVALGLDYAGRDDDFYTGVEEVLRALLQDAEFLYRIELGTPVSDEPGVFQLSDHEIAARMSFMLWGSTPSAELLDRADAGELTDPQTRAEVVERMLSRARTRRHVDRFHALWLGYHELPHTPDLTNAMRAESAALVERVVFDEGSSWLDLFTASETWLDDTLAQHYGLPSPGSQPAWVDYGTSDRQGLLSHGSFLSVAANPGDTSPTKRGKLIRNRLLCQVIPPPPPDAPADEPPSEESGECKADQYAAHREPGPCKTCHDQMDPIGFGLENYDASGRFRAHDDGKPQCTIEGQGELVGVGTFSGPAELSDLVLDNGLADCGAEHMYRFAMGHAPGPDDRDFVDDLQQRFTDADHRFDQLLVEIVAHPAFGFRREESSQ